MKPKLVARALELVVMVFKMFSLTVPFLTLGSFYCLVLHQSLVRC